MQSLRKLMLLGVAAALAVALAAPATAAANWTKEGNELSATPELQWASGGVPLTESKAITLQGPMKFEGEESVELECSMTLKGTVGAGFKGTISEVSASNCILGPVLKFLGCKAVKSVTANDLPWPLVPAHSGGKKAIYLGVSLTYVLEGGIFCYKTATVSGLVIAKPNSAEAISSVALSGGVDVKLGYGEKFYPSQAFANGTLSVSPGAYGMLTTNLVGLSGTLSWASELGTLQCTVNGLLALERGSEGKLNSVTWSGCFLGGGYGCGAVKSVTTGSLPSTVIDEGTRIRIPVSFTIEYTQCGKEMVSGTLFATPDNASAISSTSLSGTLEGSGGKKAWSGSVKWSPAGVYGL